MPAILTRADSLREYHSGASSAGAAQLDPALSLGHYRSGTEAVSLGIAISSPISGVTVSYAGGANPVGTGVLTAVDGNNLTWQPYGSSLAGPPAFFSGTAVAGIVEGVAAGQYLRVLVSTPLTPGSSLITLARIYNNIFALADIAVADAAAGVIDYRATILRNESVGTITSWQRWLGLLGSEQVSNTTYLSGSGSGTIVTTGSLISWPTSGWAQVRSSLGVLKEVVYYSARTNTALSITAAGRGLLGTTATAGSSTDIIYPVPGIAIGLDPAGVQAAGSTIQLVGSPTTAPSGVTWNVEILPGSGLQVASISPGEEFAVWIKRHIPAGIIASPQMVNQLFSGFNAT